MEMEGWDRLEEDTASQREISPRSEVSSSNSSLFCLKRVFYVCIYINNFQYAWNLSELFSVSNCCITYDKPKITLRTTLRMCFAMSSKYIASIVFQSQFLTHGLAQHAIKNEKRNIRTTPNMEDRFE